MALAAFLVVGCITIIGTCAEIEHAQAADSTPQAKGTAGVPAGAPLANTPPSPPSPNFNPSSPYTVHQSNETPVSPTAPGTSPGAH